MGKIAIVVLDKRKPLEKPRVLDSLIMSSANHVKSRWRPSVGNNRTSVLAVCTRWQDEEIFFSFLKLWIWEDQETTIWLQSYLLFIIVEYCPIHEGVREILHVWSHWHCFQTRASPSGLLKAKQILEFSLKITSMHILRNPKLLQRVRPRLSRILTLRLGCSPQAPPLLSLTVKLSELHACRWNFSLFPYWVLYWVVLYQHLQADPVLL